MNDLYRRLVDHTRDGVYRYTFKEGRILMANQALVEILDLDCGPEKLIGKPLRDFLVYTEKEGSVRKLLREKGAIHDFEYSFRTLAGETKWVLHDSILTVDPQTGEEIVEAIVKDITGRKRSEEALNALNRELEAFAYSVSHDLQAPLRRIVGFCKALEEDCGKALNTQGKDYLRRIVEGTSRMQALINDLLDLSRLTRSEMTLTDVRISDLAREIMEDLRSGQPERNVDFIVEDGLTARGDRRLLGIALRHLLENAWKFTGRNKTSRIEFGALQLARGRVYCVRDDGAGFDMNYVEKLFGPFQRLHSADDFPGTGIGLATVQRIIHRHGGRIWAEGRIERGATFYFTLGERGMDLREKDAPDE